MNNKIYNCAVAAFVMIVPIPGRIVFAFYLLLLFNILTSVSVLCSHAVRKLDLDFATIPAIIFVMIVLTVFYKQLLSIFCPVVSLTLDFSIYIPAVSSLAIIFNSSQNSQSDLESDIKSKMKSALFVTLIVFAFFAARDIVGFGTITLPGKPNIITIRLPFSNPENFSVGAFLATIPGSFVLFASALFCCVKIAEKKSLSKNAVPESEIEENENPANENTEIEEAESEAEKPETEIEAESEAEREEAEQSEEE